ncbi:Lrp/AsnC family transcriptional regulator [archaeon]|jgi:Lrp/AsnC family transcriptional regulator, leucine-responsive regulatory protein|nr:Lrp/AsnC family transcriptional regulator [archaeon]MBT3577299.1 Lrp/AsnC family transcriptional regulator [archaeon]MBT6820457.1 Lrp/AsnC family transcriptional regulator [archaeon]MBT6956282.1 Lrp/AsnC family transcriptional regulator [archaeon]MBT7025271.1 Lrp/AsnC family transcriptional regulator [archaeon]
MKDITPKLINLFKQGYCAPQISRISKKIKEPSTTIHYNIKKLEKEGKIKSYKAVFDYKKIGEGHCTYILVNLLPSRYGSPEEAARDIAKDSRVESIDICTGDYELLVKLRTKDIDEYYEYIKTSVKKFGFAKTVSMTSLKQLKTEFVETED